MTGKIIKSLFGVMPDGREVFNYTLIDEKNQSVVMSEYACAIIEINVLGNDGKLHDVALGYDTLEEYLNDTRNFGATVGRYANRIADGKFILNGATYHLPRNNGKNTLHGGFHGFGKKLFSSEIADGYVIFKLHSPDLDEGFPGNFDLAVKTSFTNGTLKFVYDYVCDHDTPANITNHNYFNLNGHGTGCIFNHDVFINAERYCKADKGLLALAPAVKVEGAPFDFRTPKKIAEGIFSYSPEIINASGGYDHCFEIKNCEGEKPAAVVTGDKSGIKLEISTDMPSLQFYTGNKIGHTGGKNGAFYNNFDGFAMECEQFPNAVNEPSFPDAVIKAGQPVSHFIEYKFS